MRNWYRIGEIAALFQIPVETLRYYDREGLLRPERVASNGYRMYGSTQLERICTVLSLRAAGVPAAEIRAILGTDSADTAVSLLDEQVSRLDDHLAALTRARLRLFQTREALREWTQSPIPVVRHLRRQYLLAIPFRFDVRQDVAVKTEDKHSPLPLEQEDGELDIEQTRDIRDVQDPGWIKGASVVSLIAEPDIRVGRYHRYSHYGLMSEEPLSGDQPYIRILEAGPYVVAPVRVQSLAHEEVDAVYDRMIAFAGSLGLHCAGPAIERTVFDLEPEDAGTHIHFFSLMIPVSRDSSRNSS